MIVNSTDDTTKGPGTGNKSRQAREASEQMPRNILRHNHCDIWAFGFGRQRLKDQAVDVPNNTCRVPLLTLYSFDQLRVGQLSEALFGFLPSFLPSVLCTYVIIIPPLFLSRHKQPALVRFSKPSPTFVTTIGLMASKPAMRLTRVLRSAHFVRPVPRIPTVQFPTTCRAYSTDPPDAPLLQKLKGELKAAMRAKDKPRLQVLRAVMSANLNASKTSSPITTDLQLVGLMRKLQQNGKDAISEASAAGREDLVEKEQQQVDILGEYVANSGIETMGEAELKALVVEAIEASKSAGNETSKMIFGDAMKRLNVTLSGKDVDKKGLVGMIKDIVGQ